MALIVAALAASCVRATPRTTPDDSTTVDVSPLWVAPADLAQRDLFHGPGGPELAPDSSASYTLVAVDRGGYSQGYDVRGPNGVQWSVKLGPEAQPEVAVSRLLWAIGYHQPPVYYVERWTLTGAEASGTQEPARFRPDLPDRKVVGEWSWYDNDLVATQPFRGLVVANLILNNWDWKTSNNKIYEVSGAGPFDFAQGGPSRVYVVRDLGASLGKTTFPKILNFFPMRGLGQGTRNDLEGFESQGFIRRVSGERIEFDYRGIHGKLVKIVTPRDVLWTSELMAKLSDAQWADAFRAAGFPAEHGKRYTAKIKAKIAEGLKLADAG